MLRVLADENIPAPVVKHLRELGHDVLAVGETARASDDPLVLSWARRDRRLLLTMDKDFRRQLPDKNDDAPPSILLVRLENNASCLDPVRVAGLLKQGMPWEHQFGFINHRGELRLRCL